MLKLKLITIISLTLVASVTQADSKSAKELMSNAKCMRCHTNSHFQHREMKVNNFKKLYKSVKACAANTSAEWFDDETKDVALHLNKEHYKYKLSEKEKSIESD